MTLKQVKPDIVVSAAHGADGSDALNRTDRIMHHFREKEHFVVGF